MAGRHKWSTLQAKRSPRRRRRIAGIVAEMKRELLLAEIRGIAGLTQSELAGRTGLKQANVSRAERQGDMNVGTLRRMIEGLGGRMEIIAHMPAGDIRVMPFSRAGAKDPH